MSWQLRWQGDGAIRLTGLKSKHVALRYWLLKGYDLDLISIVEDRSDGTGKIGRPEGKDRAAPRDSRRRTAGYLAGIG